ncbi:MAG TPA: hypothetical protein VFD23_06735, partial [Clostridia bacterium]|nr:hypothetical protein [Clostridia bacterium]
MSNKGKQENNSKYQPIKLLKTVSFPTYQLYAEVENKKTDAATALKIAVAETFSWLRTRFRAFEEIPAEMLLPEPADHPAIKVEDIRSFRINEGYVVDVVYIKEKGIWALNLIEPDLGTTSDKPEEERQPVAGRVFETNIAFRISNNTLECGFKTICSEPTGTDAPCEAFRVSVVKTMVRNKDLGLRQKRAIRETPHTLDSNEKIKRIAAYIRDEDRQLPLVIVSEYMAAPDLSDFFKSLEQEKAGLKTSLLGSLESIVKENFAKGIVELPTNFGTLAKLCMGYAHFYVLPHKSIDLFNEKTKSTRSLSNGDMVISFPVNAEEEDCVFTREEICRDQQAFFQTVREKITTYPIRTSMDFGNVKFIKEARAEEQQTIIDMGESKDDLVQAFNIKLENEQSKHADEAANLRRALSDTEKRVERLKTEINGVKADKKSLLEKLEENAALLEDSDKSRKQEYSQRAMLLDRPSKPEEISAWVEKYFEGRLILHNNAVNLLKKITAAEVDMPLLCDCIEYLASEHRDYLLRKISQDEMNTRCSEKYGRPFIVTPSGENCIKA